jgi:hypothetical protein
LRLNNERRNAIEAVVQTSTENSTTSAIATSASLSMRASAVTARSLPGNFFPGGSYNINPKDCVIEIH